jgi:GT2 family glycosyltransferase
MIAKGEIGNLTVLGEYSLKKTSLTKGYFYTTALSGNALLYKKTIVDEPFPSRYFAYAEDVFLNLYLLSRGWKMGYCPASIVHHY